MMQNTVQAFGRFLTNIGMGEGRKEEFNLYHTDKLERHIFPTSFAQDCALLSNIKYQNNCIVKMGIDLKEQHHFDEFSLN